MLKLLWEREVGTHARAKEKKHAAEEAKLADLGARTRRILQERME